MINNNRAYALNYYTTMETTQTLAENRDAQLDFDRDLARFSKESDAAIQLTRDLGMSIDLTEWLSVKRYAERYGLTTQVVTNWMARGIIPADCTMTLPELNGIRLVKNQHYR